MSDPTNPFDSVFTNPIGQQQAVELPAPPEAFAQVGGNTSSPNNQQNTGDPFATNQNTTPQNNIDPFTGNGAMQPNLQPTQQPMQNNNPFENSNQQNNNPFGNQQQPPVNNMAYQQPQPQPQQYGNAPPQQQYGNNNQYGGGAQAKEKKYDIIDLYWLVNINPNRQQNEFEGLAIGYNANFDNIRLTFYGPGGAVLSDTQLHLDYKSRAGSANMYAEAAQELLYRLKRPVAKDQPKHTVQLIEKSITSNSKYTPAKSSIVIHDDILLIYSVVNNSVGYFPLMYWQVECLMSAIQFMLNHSQNARLLLKPSTQNYPT